MSHWQPVLDCHPIALDVGYDPSARLKTKPAKKNRSRSTPLFASANYYLVSYMKISAKFRMPIMGFYRLEILPKKIEIFQYLVVTGTIFGQIYQ
jgi:hypothetical protein